MPGPDEPIPVTPAVPPIPHDPADTNATTGNDGQPPAASTPQAPWRYVLEDEIARGGMGVVYRAADAALDREVAVKVLHDRFRPDSGTARRFADEARITAQLQHPGIPAVHDLGTLPDGRPFLAMKLIKGRTLHDWLKSRTDPAADRGRYVAAFEQICQAVAYAHAHKVIHRDLKPHNVMVGAFGEVQVMDWGLAKVLGVLPSEGGDPNETAAPTDVRGRRDSDAFTLAGSILGTPAFMPPEQAAGSIERIDRRSDVFGLGAILAVVLTGQPPYAGETAEAVRDRAARGKVEDCFARLDRCGADPGLVALCKRCLAPEKEGRPADAGVVALEVARLRQAAEDRARQAEIDRVRRRWQLVLGGGVGLLLIAVAAAAWWLDRRETARAAEDRRVGEQAQAAARRRVEVAVRSAADQLDQFRFGDARKALDHATEQLPPDAPDDLPEAIASARADLDLVRELDDIRFGRVRGNPTGGAARMTAAYRAVFSRRGLDPSTDPGAAGWVKSSRVKRFLVLAIDGWARYEADPAAQARLAALARAADPSPESGVLRDPAAWADAAGRERLARRVDLDALPPNLLVLYFQVRDEAWPGAALVYARAANRFPDDFWVQFEAAYYHVFKEPNPAEAIPYLRAALAVRPDHVYAFYLLGRALAARGRTAEAADALRRALALDPGYADARVMLRELEPPGTPPAGGGKAAFERGQRAEKEERFGEAADHYRAAIDQGHDPAPAYYRLGIALRNGGGLDDAAAALLKSLEYDDKAHWTYYELGAVYTARKRWADAARCYERFIERDTKFAYAYNDLAIALSQLGRLERAVEAARRAAKLAPKDPNIVHGRIRLERLLAESQR